LYCALDPNEFDEAKYHHEPIDAKIFEDVPMLVKIKSGLGLRKAKELVDITMAKFGIEKDEKAKTVDYVAKYPYEPNEPLIARKLIKLLIADDAVVVMSTKPKEEPVVEEVVEVIPEPIVEEAIEEVIEEPVEEVAEEPVEEVVEEPAIEEPVIEEIEEEPYVEPEVVVESVSAEDAHQIVEEKQVEIHVEESVDYIGPKDNKKAIINIDTLSNNYEAHEIVNIQSMKDKKLIDKKAKCVKVLARGILSKPLRIKAGEFSRTAVEMILLTGGQAIHVEYRIKK
jgi:ribosomal protein L15